MKSEFYKSFLYHVSSVEEKSALLDNSNTVIPQNFYIQILCYSPNTVINVLCSHLVVAY